MLNFGETPPLTRMNMIFDNSISFRLRDVPDKLFEVLEDLNLFIPDPIDYIAIFEGINRLTELDICKDENVELYAFSDSDLDAWIIQCEINHDVSMLIYVSKYCTLSTGGLGDRIVRERHVKPDVSPNPYLEMIASEVVNLDEDTWGELLEPRIGAGNRVCVAIEYHDLMFIEHALLNSTVETSELDLTGIDEPPQPGEFRYLEELPNSEYEFSSTGTVTLCRLFLHWNWSNKVIEQMMRTLPCKYKRFKINGIVYYAKVRSIVINQSDVNMLRGIKNEQ